MEFNDKAMIALSVPDPELYAMPVQDDTTIPADDLHITLAYLGDAADITEEERAAILDACQTLADTSMAPESLFPANTGVFPPEPGVEDAEVPTYAAPSNPELFDTLRQDLMVHLGARGVAERVADKHPVFTPHVTLAYSPLGERPDVSHLPTPLPTRFSTLRVSFGPEDHTFELSTPVEGTPLPLTASVRAQLARLAARTETSEDYLTALYFRQRSVKATPAQTRAQAALNNVTAMIDPNFRSKDFDRVKTLANRVGLEADPAKRTFVASRALALASKHAAASPVEARELGALTASLRTIIADGNSSVARSLRARQQLRDRYGRWIEQGGGVRFKVRVPGAPGGGTWYHGTVEGFDIPNGRVNVKLEDGRIVGIPNKKIEQPKAILGLRTKIATKAKTFLPKSANRSNPELEQPLRQADPETDKLDTAAMDALDNIYELSKGVATKDPGGGNLVRLAIDASNSDAYKVAKENGSTDFDFTGVVAPFKGEAIAFDVADVDAVRAAYDNRVNKGNVPAEGATEEEAKKTLQKAQSSAIGYLAGLFNDKNDEDTVALRKAPSVGTDQDLEEVAPENANPTPDEPGAMELVDAVDDAYNKFFDLVPDESPLSGARDKIGNAIQGANERFVNNEDDLNTYLKNLDSIKEFANDQEPAFKSPSAVANPAQDAFGAFAEDVDDIHASAKGVDEIDNVRSALGSVTSAIDDIQENPEEFENSYVDDLQAAVYNVENGIKSGKYLNNTDGLGEDLDAVVSEMEDLGLESHPSYEETQLARAQFGAPSDSESPAEPPTAPAPPATPEAPDPEPAFKPMTAEDITALNPLEPMAYDDGAGIAAPGVDIPLPDGNHAYLTKTTYNANENYGDAGVFRVTVRPGPGTVPLDAQVFKYDESPYGSQNGSMNQDAAKKAVADWINAKAEGAAPKTGEGADLDAVEDYTDAPEGASDEDKQAFLKFQDVHGAMYDLMSDGDEGFISSSNPDTDTQILDMSDKMDSFDGYYMSSTPEQKQQLVDDIYSAATNVAEAFGADQAYDSSKIQALVDSATDLKATFGSQEEQDAPEIGNVTVGENAPGFSDFSDLNSKFNDFLVPYQEEELPMEAYDRAATAGNTVANVGKDLQEGKIDANEAVDLLANAVTDINDLLSADDDLADSEFGMDLDSLMGEVSNLQGRLSTDGFNPDEDNAPEPAAPAPVVPDKSTWDGLDSNEKAAIDDEASMLLSWLNTKSEQLQGEPDYEEGQGAGFEKPFVAIKDFTTLQDDLEEASLAYGDGELTNQGFADALQAASDKWMNSDGFAELAAIGDEDGTMAEEFDTDQNISALIEKIPGVVPTEPEPEGDVPGTDDPWADVPAGRTSPWTGQTPASPVFDAETPLAEWEKELLSMINESLPVLEETVPEAVAPVQKLLNDLDDTMKLQEPVSELAELLMNGGNIYLDEMDAIPAQNDDAAAAIEGAKAPVEDFIEKIEAADFPDELDAQVEMSKLQGIIDSLNAQDGFIQKILAGSLQEKLDNGEEISASDLEQVQAFLGNIADSDNTTPEEKADYQLAKDALDVEAAVPADAPEAPEVPETPAEALPEAPEAPATPAATPETLEESIAAWKTSLSDYLASPAFTGSDPTAAMVHGSVHNPLNDKQVENIQSLVDSYGPGGLSANDADKLQKALNAHKSASISDDELIQAISSIGDNYAFYSKVAGRLRGAQSGIQVNKPALVGVLRPKEEYYGNPDDLDDTDFFMASPEVVQGTLNKILEQSLAGADLEALLKTAAVGTDDAAVSGHIDNAKMFVSVALDALQTGNAEFMIANMRDALNEFDSAIALRASTHKNDKVIRRLRARRRSLDETLAAFEGRWPDPVVGGTQQAKHGGFIIDNTASMEDKDGNAVYPGDIIERTYGSAKGQLALAVATANVNNVPRALVQLDDHPDVYHNGLGNKSFVLSAVGPNNPLYSDPSYTGPKVDSSPGTFGDLTTIQKTYADNQVKKGKGAAAPTPTDEPTPETVEADVPAPVEPTVPATTGPQEAGSFKVGDTVDFYNDTELENGKIVGFDSVGSQWENAVVEGPDGTLHSVLTEWLEEEKNKAVKKPKDERAELMQAEVFETSSIAGLEEIAKKVQVAGLDGLGVKGYNTTMMKLDEKYKLLTGGTSIAEFLESGFLGDSVDDAGPEKPVGLDVKEESDPEQYMKDLPVGAKVITDSSISGLDYETYTKREDGYWQGEYDTISHQGVLEKDYVVVSYQPPVETDDFDPNDPDSDGFDDGQDDFDEPFIFDATTMVGDIMDIPTLFELDEYADRLENALNGGEITESQYNAAMGIVNYRRDQLENPPEPPGGGGGGPAPDDAPDAPPAPAAPGASVFQPLPADQKGQDGDMWVTVNGQHKWGRYGAAGVAVTHTDADGNKFVLLGKRGDRDEWYLPGGALDEGESPIQGATREFIEEATEGADIAEMLTLVSESEYDAGVIDNTDGEHWKYTTIIADLPDMVDVTVPPGSNPYELGEYKWMSAEDLQLLDDQGSLHAAMSNGRFAKLIGFQEGEAEPLTDATLTPTDLATAQYDMSGWKKIKNAGGSNNVALYQDANGNKFYAKPAQSDAHAHNEVLASALYERMGVSASKARIGELNGKKYIVSPEVVGDQSGFPNNQSKPEFLAALQDGFAVDAWLGNYDVIGNSSWNVIADENGMPVRIDAGGALLYRGTGSVKSWWGNKVTELKDMRFGSNKSGSYGNAKTVFGKMSDDQVRESAKKLLDISPTDIQEIVSSTGFAPDVQKSLVNTLIQRRHNILAELNIADNPEMKKLDDAKAIQNSMPAGVPSYNVGQKVKFKGTEFTGVVKTVYPDGLIKVKQDGSTDGFATMAHLDDIEPADIPDAVAEGGKVFLFSKGKTNFAVGDKIYYLDGPSQEWVSGTLMDNGVNADFSGEKYVNFESDGGVVWGVNIKDVISDLAYQATAPTEVYDAPPATIDAAADVWAELGDGFATPPPGSTLLKKQVSPYFGIKALVQHPDGTLMMYANYGSEAGQAAKAFVQKPESYKPEKGWVDIHTTGMTSVEEDPFGEVKTPVEPIFGEAYANVPEGAIVQYKLEDGNLNPYLVSYPDGSMAIFYNDGDTMPFVEDVMDPADLGWEEYTGLQKTEMPAAPSEPGYTLPAGFATAPAGSIVHYQNVNTGAMVVEHPDGTVWSYYNDGGGTLQYADLIKESLLQSMDSNTEGFDKINQIVGDSPANSATVLVAPNDQLDLGVGYATPPSGAKALYKEMNGQYQSLLVQHPDGDIHIYWNDGTSGYYSEEIPESVVNNSNPESGNNWVKIAEQVTAGTPETTNTDPNAPLTSEGKPVAVGDQVKIIKYAKKGKPTIGQVMKVTPDGAVRVKLMNDDGTTYLDEKGKAVYSIAASKNIRHNETAKISAKDLTQDGVPSGLIFSNPDTSNPLYGTEKPAPPVAPGAQGNSAVSDEWIEKADALYKQRKLNKYPNDPNPKGAKESSYWNTYYANVMQGSETDLKWLLDNDYIDQALFDEAKSQQTEYLTKQGALMAEYQVEYDAWTDKFAEWKKAQGGASVVPVAHNDPSIQSWSHSEAWTNMNEQFADQIISGPASSGAGLQKSGGWQEHIRSIAQTVGLKKEDIAAQPNVSSGAMTTWEKLSGLGGLASNQGVKKGFRAIMTRRYWQFSGPDGKPFNASSDLSSMKGTIQKDFGAMEMTPGSVDDGGKYGYAGHDYKVLVDLVVPAGIKGVWTGNGGWGFEGKSGEMGFIAESGLAMYIWDVEAGSHSLSGTGGGGRTFTHKVKASLIPTELYPYMEYFEGNPDSHDVILPEQAQKIIDQYKQPLGLTEGTTSTNPFENQNDGTVGDN